ncbi:MAG: DUF3416 domain-containing protein [Candidatus Planktophila sp.]|nr:DUF3416 domain-containing protein [Candidatus Planktophila sp.]
MISRIAISDISPAVFFGGEFLPVKAVPGERITVSATVVIEGHEKLTAEIVLHSDNGKVVSRSTMVENWPGSSRFMGEVKIPTEGNFFFIVEADSVTQYRTVLGSSEKYPIFADRKRALFGSWYEFFPRSEGAIKNKDGTITSGTFKTAAQRIPAVAAMGFDVVYLPPIHPIGLSHRKGANNSLTPKESDPGVPWAIGSADGGHDAINPELGTMDDFENFISIANKNGVEIALDLALQTSPDHPWVHANPQWFNKRPDGTIAYAENPPKKYQDIYPLNFDDDYEGLRDEILRVIRLWVSKGVSIFRVDNPHTKPVHFWQDLLEIMRIESPEVVFLAEAFTAPAMMHALGKAGFHQSYTYFTWRTSKSELIDYGREVSTQSDAYFRPNFWVNTPDINPFHLHSGNPAVFALRAVLASTLSPSWGMYAGYELYEHLPFKLDGEEYLDSEKYEIKVRDWDGAAKKGVTLAPFITQLNAIRAANPALHQLRNLVFHNTDSDAIIAYSKRDDNNLIIVIVNLDPNYAQGTIVHWDMNSLGISGTHFEVEDLLDGSHFNWSPDTYISLDPTRPVGKVAHICRVKI